MGLGVSIIWINTYSGFPFPGGKFVSDYVQWNSDQRVILKSDTRQWEKNVYQVKILI